MREWNGPGSSFLGQGPLWTQGDRSKVSWKNRPSMVLLPWLQLGSSSSLSRGKRTKEKEENGYPPFLHHHQKAY